MPPDFSGPSARPDPAVEQLAHEQHHLVESRAALRRMRQRTASMSAMGGDGVSAEYLKLTLYKRMRALEDDPEIPLFFGRLDYRDEERFYVGRRHVTNETGDPLVVDWRAPVSRPFYRASSRDAMGLHQRRRFGFQQGLLTAYEDEKLEFADASSPQSTILESEIERPRVGPMRDIVATIQPEQDDIVRADLATSVCVQGAPGTGKTAVGLHRAAFLLYAHRDQLRRQGVLVVGPNESFLRYIGDVLPALGEIDAKQTTVEELAARVTVTAVDDIATARLKGDARMATVLDLALWSQLAVATEALTVPMGARRWRLPAYEIDELVSELRNREVRYGAGRAMLPQRLAHSLLVKMELAGDAPDDRIQSAVARSRAVKQLVDLVWPAVEPRRLVWRMLSDRSFLDDSSRDVLSDAERSTLTWARPPRGPGTAKWSLHDAVLVDEAADLIDRTPSLGHVVLDEAQDLSPMMLRCVGRRCSTSSVTVLGDLAQATSAWAVGNWRTTLTHLGHPQALLEELTLGFRVPADVIEYAARLLPRIAPDLTPPSSVRRGSGDLRLTRCSDPAAAAVAAARSALDQPGSVAIIAPDTWVPQLTTLLGDTGQPFSIVGDQDDMQTRLNLVGATLAKGLEFDHVVLVEPAQIAAEEADEIIGLRRLYVCLTRAVTSLQVVHAEPLPAALDG